MKQKIAFVLFIIVFFAARLMAAEGMWLPFLLKQLNEKEMKSLGMKISAEDIYSINKSSLKDAVFLFGGGCTSEIVSSQGLVFTNHHCGFGNIQSHSSVEKNYLKNGFVAASLQEELPNEGLSVSRIVMMRDVTNEVLNGVRPGMSRDETDAEMKQNINAIKSEATKGTHYEAIVKPFFYGNQYVLIVSEVFKDVRLVFAPPQCIGEFGGDTDNWMWPRHNGDFCVFRIYAGKDNKPAAYSAENVPYQPLRHLNISLKGVKEGDFTFVYGFPGTTQQYLSSFAVNYIMNIQNPMRVNLRREALAIMNAAMQSSEALKIKYAAKEARISNAYKKWIGEGKGLRRLNALAVKQALESKYLLAAAGNEEFTKVINSLKQNYLDIARFNKAHDLYIEYIFSGPEIIRFAKNFTNLVENYETLKSNGEVDKTVASLKTGISGYFKNYDFETDKKLFAAITSIFMNEIPDDLCPDVLSAMKRQYNGNWQAFTDDLYKASALPSKTRMESFLNSINAEECEKMKSDPGFVLSKSIYDTYLNGVEPTYGAFADQIDAAMKIYVKGLMTLLPNYRKYYPDANGTLRVAYGKVEGFRPMDGKIYDYYTTATGILEKYVPGDTEFDLDARTLELLQKKDFGRYGQNGELRIAFTASNHTTGGNSGSPVMNAKGELIGINFDRAWESTMSDIMYDPERCRNIVVDIRYVLWVIDKWGNAGRLIEEMNLVN
jgi:hypothetical protein